MTLNLEPYKWIFFDAGGTLLEPYPSVGEIYARVAKKYGSDLPPKTLNRLFKEIWIKRDGLSGLVGHSNEKKEREWWRSLVTEVFTHFPPLPDFEAYFDELYEMFGHPSVWRLFPETLAVIEALSKQGKQIGIISNWDSRLFQLCEGFGLKSRCPIILASAVFGAAKPSPKIFQEALRLAGTVPHEAVHVGDSFEDDVCGARKAGMEAVLINRHPGREIPEHQKGPFPVIHSLGELLTDSR